MAPRYLFRSNFPAIKQLSGSDKVYKDLESLRNLWFKASLTTDL